MNENSKSAQKNPSFLDETHLSSSQVNLEIFKTLKLRLNKKSSQSQDTPKFIFPYDS